MAARWGTGEEIIKTSKMEYFPPSICEEVELLQGSLCSLSHNSLDTIDATEALQSCLDSSILSLFEGTSATEVKSSVDEASLLTALTEILDNVDDENLSPFDTLPDVGFLQGQADNEHSQLRTLLSLSCSPERESVFNSRQFHGLTSNEDIDPGFSELLHNLDVSSELDMCLPISLEHDGEMVAFTLSDLVKHMHPYAMTVCVEGKEELLSDGGIILEVMDKGEDGEPILAIQDLNFPLSLSSTGEEQHVPEISQESVKLMADGPPAEIMTCKVSHIEDNQVNNVIKQHEKGSAVKCLSKNLNGDAQAVAEIFERHVLSKPDVKESKIEPEEEQKRKKKVTFATEFVGNDDTMQGGKLSLGVNNEIHIERGSSSLTPATPDASVTQLATIITATVPSSVPKENGTCTTVHENSGETETLKQDSAVSPASEPKPKSISLQQYRLLRQQKKPTPLEKVEENKTKWPTLPEAPKELPPIPHLPEPSFKDPRHAVPVKDSIPDIMPAWQPRGPGAPPTPEALLIPPASMRTSTKTYKAVNSKLVSQSPIKPVENHSTSPVSLVPPDSNNRVPYNVPQNTTAKETCAAMQVSLDSSSLPEDSRNEVLQNTDAVKQEKCLQVTPLVSDPVTAALPKKQENLEPQEVNKITKHDHDTSVAASKTQSAAVKRVAEQTVEASAPKSLLPTKPVKTLKPTVSCQRHIAPIAGQPFSTAPIQARIMKLAEQMRRGPVQAPKAKNPTAELIESFTSEIGIEATDLASLLEQFEETQPKEKSVSEVSGRAAAVGNSSIELVQTNTLKKPCSPDLASTAGLTPPATPPHQMWKPLAPVALLGKQNKADVPKPSSTKAMKIEPLPLPLSKLQNKPQTSFTTGQMQPFSQDHDYCLFLKTPCQNELGSSRNSAQPPKMKSEELHSNKSQQSSSLPSKESLLQNEKSHYSVPSSQTKKGLTNTGMVTPDASPDRLDSERLQGYPECPSSPYHHKRGRSKRKYRTRVTSRSGSISSSSRSRSPPRKRYLSSNSSRSPSRCRSRSHSQSCSRSPSPCQYRHSYSRSRSRSWSRSQSRSRSRSRSPGHRNQRLNSPCSPNRSSSYCSDLRYNENTRRRKEKAIEERRVVYIGRIRGGMTRKELRERFSYFGEIEDCTVHFREHGDNYGFVTYYDKNDAFNAIENGSKLRQPNEFPFDLCFGGRRQFCKTSYADLDSNRGFDSAPVKARFDALDFDTLLKQAQRNLKR